MTNSDFFAKKPTKHQLTEMELSNHLEAMRALHTTVLALCRHSKISPKKLIALSFDDLENELYNKSIIKAQQQFIKDHPDGKILKFTKHPIKALINKIWSKFQKPTETPSEKVPS